jgi:hypothetical protein
MYRASRNAILLVLISQINGCFAVRRLPKFNHKSYPSGPQTFPSTTFFAPEKGAKSALHGAMFNC